MAIMGLGLYLYLVDIFEVWFFIMSLVERLRAYPKSGSTLCSFNLDCKYQTKVDVHKSVMVVIYSLVQYTRYNLVQFSEELVTAITYLGRCLNLVHIFEVCLCAMSFIWWKG